MRIAIYEMKYQIHGNNLMYHQFTDDVDAIGVGQRRWFIQAGTRWFAHRSTNVHFIFMLGSRSSLWS